MSIDNEAKDKGKKSAHFKISETTNYAVRMKIY